MLFQKTNGRCHWALGIGAVLVALSSTSMVAAEKPDNQSGQSRSHKTTATATPPVGILRSDVAIERFDISLPLRLVKPKPIPPMARRGGLIADPGPVNSAAGGGQDRDPVVQGSLENGLDGAQRIPAPSVSFDGLSNLSGVAPPDPVGDIGPQHFVAMSNLSFAVYDRSGNVLFGPAANNTLFSGFGGDCETDNAGDPIVLYDQFHDRWILSQFTSPNSGPPFYNCVAISTSPDPTGSYYRWAISTGNAFPDYPKYGIWSDAIYISTREFTNNSFTGIGAYALKIDEFIAGNPAARVVSFVVPPGSAAFNTGDGLLPADIDGNTLPPAGSPEYFVGSMDDGGPKGAPQDALTLWKFVADFDTPANSSFTLTDTLPIAAYDTIFDDCSGRDCIPQKDTSNGLDIQSYRQRPLFRLAYRNFGSHESLVTNQSVEAASGPSIAGIRWWEIRSPNSTPIIYQEGTFAPGLTDGIHRWMGSAAMDAEGNIGLAYSASSDSIYPGLRYTGRLKSDPLGQMPQGEGIIVEGTGSQTGPNRWGDYSSLNIDPIDDCTFWFVSEYVPVTSSRDWQLRIGAFKFNECGDPGFYMSSSQSSQSVCSTQTGATADFPIQVGSISNFDSPVTLTATGLAAGTGENYSQNPVTPLPGSTTLTVSNFAGVASGVHAFTVDGSATGAADKSLNLALNVFATAPTGVQLQMPVDGAVNQDIRPSLSWSANGAESYNVLVASDPALNNVVFAASTSGTSVAVNVDLGTNTTYYWTVSADNACGSVASAVQSFTTAPAPGDCGAGTAPAVSFTEDFESGAAGWSSSGTGDTWAQSNAQVHGGSFSWHADDPSTVSDQQLVSPAIPLPLGQQLLTLQFWNRQTMESRSSGGCWDGGVLEISTDGGASWTQVTTDKLLTDPYDGAVSALGDSAGWCGDPQDWLKSVVDLSDWAGQTVQFRFRLGSDSSVSREGWYLDDLTVQGCVPTTDLIFKHGFE